MGISSTICACEKDIVLCSRMCWNCWTRYDLKCGLLLEGIQCAIYRVRFQLGMSVSIHNCKIISFLGLPFENYFPHNKTNLLIFFQKHFRKVLLWSVTAPTILFNIWKLYILPTEGIYVFMMHTTNRGISVKSINCLVFIKELRSVYRTVETELLNTI